MELIGTKSETICFARQHHPHHHDMTTVWSYALREGLLQEQSSAAERTPLLQFRLLCVCVCVFDSVYQQAAVITALVFSVSATAIDCQLSTVLCLSLFLSVWLALSLLMLVLLICFVVQWKKSVRRENDNQTIQHQTGTSQQRSKKCTKMYEMQPVMVIVMKKRQINEEKKKKQVVQETMMMMIRVQVSEWQDGTSWLTLITQLRPLRRPSRLIESISTVDGAVGQFWQARPNRGAKDEGPFYDSRSGKRGPEIDLIDAFDHSTPAATLFWNSNSSVHCKLFMFAAFTEKQKRFIWYEQ